MICFPYSSITKHNNILGTQRLFLSGSRGMVRRSSDVLAICCRHAGPRCLLGNPSLGLVILWEKFSQVFYMCSFCALQLQLLSKSRSSHSVGKILSGFLQRLFLCFRITVKATLTFPCRVTQCSQKDYHFILELFDRSWTPMKRKNSF